MSAIVRQQLHDGPTVRIFLTNLAKTRYVRKSSRQQLQQHVFNRVFELVSLINNQDRNRVGAGRVCKSSQRLAQHEVIQTPLLSSSLFQLQSRSDRLAYKLNLTFCVPAIKCICQLEALHTLQ